PLPLTNGLTRFTDFASSIDTAINFTPVSFCHSSYTSLIAESSLRQGPHQVAQKLMIIGFSSLDKSLIFNAFPSMSFNTTEGNSFRCAFATKEEINNNNVKKTFIKNIYLFWNKQIYIKKITLTFLFIFFMLNIVM